MFLLKNYVLSKGLLSLCVVNYNTCKISKTLYNSINTLLVHYISIPNDYFYNLLFLTLRNPTYYREFHKSGPN
jgi:hypothetical protein